MRFRERIFRLLTRNTPRNRYKSAAEITITIRRERDGSTSIILPLVDGTLTFSSARTYDVFMDASIIINARLDRQIETMKNVEDVLSILHQINTESDNDLTR